MFAPRCQLPALYNLCRGCYKESTFDWMETRRLRNARRLAAFFFVYAAVSFYHAAAAAPEAGKRPISRIQSPTNVVYLLGSIHYLKPQNYPLDPAIEAAFKDAKTVVFEMDLDSTKGDEAQHLLVKKAAYPDKTTLQQHVSE